MRRGSRFATYLLITILLTTLMLPLSEPVSVRAYRERREDSEKVFLLFLRYQPQLDTARRIRTTYEPLLEEASQKVHTATDDPAFGDDRPILPDRDAEVTYMEEARTGRSLSTSEAEAYRRAIHDLEALQQQMRRAIIMESAGVRQETQARVEASVRALGGQVLHRYQTLNALAVAISPDAREVLANHPDIATIYDSDQLESHMNVSTQAIGADTWWTAGYTGGIWDVAIIDSGIDHGHPALSSHEYIERRCLDTAEYYDNGLPGDDPAADDVNGHGSHVAGTVASTSSTYPGVAYGLNLLINGKAGYDRDGSSGGHASMFWFDGMACVDWALTNDRDDADVINLSYGSKATNDDGGYERFWDAVVDLMYAVVTISAGNDGPSDKTIHSPSIAYNVLSVANVYDWGTPDRSDDVLNISSSRGPTPDGRKKPDIAAPGSYIVSTNNDWESQNDYVSMSGTSMASPHVAGAATLMMDRGIIDPMAIKALLINTAEDKGDAGWDNGYGWGYIDMDHLDYHVFDYFTRYVNAWPDYHLYAGPAYSGDTASLVWHRRADYEYETYPDHYYDLSDLDLRAYDEATSYYIDSSTSYNDNVEQVSFTDNYDSVVVKVDVWERIIEGQSWERYVLATEEGFSQRTGPGFDFIVGISGNVMGPTGTEIVINTMVRNPGDLRAHDVDLQVEYDNLQKTGGDGVSLSLGDLAAGGSSNAYVWHFEKTSPEMPFVRLTASTHAYGEDFEGSWQLGGGLIYLPLVTR